MIFMRILPGFLKELMKHVPTVLFEAVEWSTLASEVPKLSRRIMQKEGYSELFEKQKAYLAPHDINLVTSVPKEFNPENTKLAAERILSLYFAQLFSPHGLFLDLGPSHLEMNQDNLNFNPSGLWTKFDPVFSLGMREIYDGFYLGDDKLFHSGLIKSGLSSPSWSETDKEELADLFKSHFGSSVKSEMSFDLETFKKSFFKVADFLLKKKVKISTDFLYLGISLVTMYSSLEKTGASVDVGKIYLKTKEAAGLSKVVNN